VSSPPLYSIGAVAEMLGCSPATLRSWEERYGVVRAERSESGRRLYSREDVEQLRFLTDTVEQGLSAADAHRLLRERLENRAGSPTTLDADSEERKPLVLLAERDPYAAEFEEFLLRTEGFDIELALNVGDAQRAYGQRDVGLAIVELLISGGAGLALCRELKQAIGVPVLAISSLDVPHKALAAGADAFLRKPLDPAELLAGVRDLVGQPSLVAVPAR
jgi:DNA-binding transcriptional MerR regulator